MRKKLILPMGLCLFQLGLQSQPHDTVLIADLELRIIEMRWENGGNQQNAMVVCRQNEIDCNFIDLESAWGLPCL